ncbi:MAG TPA: RidA family protein [Rhizomicrobium sp.]|nr:RidA family protein [Rhizomicrobium sp.]
MAGIERITRAHMKPLIEACGLCEATRQGDTLFIAGQTGMSHAHQIVDGDIRAQAVQAFRNIREVIETAGGRAENLLSLTWYLADGPRSFMEDALDVTAAREEVFPGIVTGSTAVRVRSLLTPEILVEIQAVCAL